MDPLFSLQSHSNSGWLEMLPQSYLPPSSHHFLHWGLLNKPPDDHFGDCLSPEPSWDPTCYLYKVGYFIESDWKIQYNLVERWKGSYWINKLRRSEVEVAPGQAWLIKKKNKKISLSTFSHCFSVFCISIILRLQAFLLWEQNGWSDSRLHILSQHHPGKGRLAWLLKNESSFSCKFRQVPPSITDWINCHSRVEYCDKANDKPTRLLCPWDFPGKNTRVGCCFLLQIVILSVHIADNERVGSS